MPSVEDNRQKVEEKLTYDSADLQTNDGVFRLGLIQRIEPRTWSPINPLAMSLLHDRVELHTDFRIELINSGDRVSLDDERLLTVPILFIDGLQEESDWKYLARYLMAGGFFIGDLSKTITWIFQKHGNLVPGRDVWTEQLPKTHPIFSCYYDLREGVPVDHRRSVGDGKSGSESWEIFLTFTGYFVQGRLAGISSEPKLSWIPESSSSERRELPSHVKMVINTMVYTQFQPDSMIQRLKSPDGSKEGSSSPIQK